MRHFLLAAALFSAPALAGDLSAITAAVDEQALHASVSRMVGFGTRHTLSDTVSNTRGIGAARRWVASEFSSISRQCGGCLSVVTPSAVVSGKRIPQPTEVVNVVAIQRGQSEPERVILITAHLDSRVGDVMDATSDAPGANDDASGVAVVLEAARVLSKHKFAATLVYAALSGEEQGLYGGKILADYAIAQGWQVQAQLNNDIVGNSRGMDGVHDNATVRVLSEGTRAAETPEMAKWRSLHGGEVDSPARNLARYVARVAEEHLGNFRVKLIYRTDRDGRGGDQVPFLAAGFPAIRITEAHEDYRRQHQNLRREGGVDYGDTLAGVDFGYLAQVARLNLATLAALAAAPAPPAGVSMEGAVTPHTTLRWQPAKGAKGYRIWWRESVAPQWQFSRTVPATAASYTLLNTVIDDYFFGVASLGEDGTESPVAFPGEVGAFAPPAKPKP